MNRCAARSARSALAMVVLAVAIVVLAVGGFSACSSQDKGGTDSGSGGDAGGTDSGATDSGATNPADSVLVNDAQHVIWKDDGGGFILLPPPGAACGFSARYDFDLHAGALAWSVCTGSDPSNAASYSLVTGSRVLTSDERMQATAAARAVTISDRTICGADKPNLTLEIVTASGSTVYGDDFYACNKTYAQYVVSDQLDQLGVVLRGMAHSP